MESADALRSLQYTQSGRRRRLQFMWVSTGRGTCCDLCAGACQGNRPPGGTFVVEGVLGQGGFGITYKSRDARLNRAVALKEFFPQAQGCLRREQGPRALLTKRSKALPNPRSVPAVEKQIQELVKQSFIGGLISPGLQTKSILLKKDERVAWETAAFRLKQRTSNGVPYWDSDGVGILVVTDQRVIFRADTGAMWSKPVTKLLSANHEYTNGQNICVLWIDGQQKPVAFGSVEATGTVSMGNVTFSIQLTSHDLREVIQSRCGG